MSLPFFLTGGHAFAGAHVPEVGLEFSDHREGLEEQAAERVVPVVDGRAEAGENAAVPHGGQRLVETGAVAAGGIGEAAVDGDPLLGDAEGQESLGLDDDVLLVGRAAGVADTGKEGSYYEFGLDTTG